AVVDGESVLARPAPDGDPGLEAVEVVGSGAEVEGIVLVPAVDVGGDGGVFDVEGVGPGTAEDGQRRALPGRVVNGLVAQVADHVTGDLDPLAGAARAVVHSQRAVPQGVAHLDRPQEVAGQHPHRVAAVVAVDGQEGLVVAGVAVGVGDG